MEKFQERENDMIKNQSNVNVKNADVCDVNEMKNKTNTSTHEKRNIKKFIIFKMCQTKYAMKREKIKWRKILKKKKETRNEMKQTKQKIKKTNKRKDLCGSFSLVEL